MTCDIFEIFYQFLYVFKFTMKKFYSYSLCYNKFCKKTDTPDKINYSTPSKNSEIQ